ALAPGAGQVDLVAPTASLHDPARFINRDLSELDFINRLLDLADDERVPLLERVKFLAIASTDLDDLFQVQVAGLKDQLAANLLSRSPDGRTAFELLPAIRAKVCSLVDRQARVFMDGVVPALAEAGIRLSDWDALDHDDREHLVDVYERHIFPVLTPLAVDPSHPFPYISNLSLNLAVQVVDPVTGDGRFARVKVPPVLPRFVIMPDGERFVPLEQVIAAHLSSLFPDMKLGPHYAFRVTRNADLTLVEGDGDDLLAAVEMELRRRRFGRSVRLEIESGVDPEVRDLLMRELELQPEDVYDVEGPLDLAGLWAVHHLERPDLQDDPWAPMTPPRLATASDEPADLFATIRERDVLVHHPYDSFATSVEAFIAQAAADPSVLAIKQTLYRTSGESPIVASLIGAAEAGKQVAVLIELKARFDEQANIAWARALEEAGVHVVYGLVGLKTHAKVGLVVRDEEDGIRRYCHVGTGNYNSVTARLYDDVGILSADPALGADLSELFNFLTGYSRQSSYRRIIIAPTGLRARILELIAEEAAAGPDGRIIIKVNGLDDPAVMDALYRASQAGVPIDLITRGISCLRPGVPGLSETVRVRSIVGRFLEHSRIFSFGGVGGRPLTLLIGSADLRVRNLDRRIEALVPVIDPEAQARLTELLEVELADDTNTWTLG
ncbi:MAG: polyphosphate kinase 1, partial [Acidimicrobiales bacterium]|nr:polyphosphate kinase 1 [Acidimicrobiales bacterium]